MDNNAINRSKETRALKPESKTRQYNIGGNCNCCVPQCGKSSRQYSLHFHRLPSDPQLRERWIANITRHGEYPVKFKSISVVCSRHFLPRDYSSWTPVRKRLQKGAVPTVFEDIVSLGLEVKSAHDNLESQNITTNSSVDKLTHQREVKYFQNYKLIAENDMCHTFETSHPVLSKRDDNESTGSLRNKKKKHTSVSNEDTSMFYLHRKIESRILKRKRLETHVSNIWSKKKSCC